MLGGVACIKGCVVCSGVYVVGTIYLLVEIIFTAKLVVELRVSFVHSSTTAISSYR